MNQKSKFYPFMIIGWLALTIIIGVLVFAGILWFNGRTVPEPTVDAKLATAVQATIDASFATMTGVAVKPAAQPSETPTPTALPEPVTGAQSGMGYGVQVQAVNYGDPNYWMEMAKGMRVNWIKHQILWGPFAGAAAGEEDWSHYDAVMASAQKQGLNVLLSVLTAPEWSRSTPGFDGPPDNPQDLADFIGRLIDRYPGQIGAIEVWNEQNLLRDWKTGDQLITEADPAEYVQMLRMAYAAIKAKDPNIIVVSGALSPTGVNAPDIAMDDFRYLELMVDAGLLDVADCIGLHHNGLNVPPRLAAEDVANSPEAATWQFTGPAENPHHSWSMYSTLVGYHDIIKGAKPICITEFGWPSREGLRDDLVVRPGFEFATDNTQQEQADYIVDAFNQFRELGYVRLAILFNLNLYVIDNPESSDNVLWSMLDSNGAPRQAYWSVAGMEKP
jgi:hypothetical protein